MCYNGNKNVSGLAYNSCYLGEKRRMLGKYYTLPICVFAFISFVSIALGNITLGLATLSFLFYVKKHNIAVPEEYKGYFLAIAGFVGALLISALFSGDIKLGLKTWADMRIWRMMPFVIIILSIHDSLSTKKVFGISMLGMCLGIACLIYQGLSGDRRAAGFFGHPMTFAGYLSMYLPIFLVCFLDGKVFKKYNWLTGLAFFAGCAALIFNGTRGAWLAVLPVFGFILLFYISQKNKAAIVCLALLVAAGFGLTYNKAFMARVSTITSTKYQSNTERLLIWQSAYNMFLDHPVLGVGLGQYKDNYQKKYISPKAKEPYITHAHNNFLHMLAENGMVGFLGFVGMIGYFMYAPFMRFWKNHNPYALMLFSFTLSLALQGLTENNFGNSAVMKAFWLLLGCLLVLDYNYKKD